MICLDGCHLKTKYGGILLTAVGMDPNDCIYPISMAVVEVENTESWKWFLSTLKRDLGITNTKPWTIMSDKQKVIAMSDNMFTSHINSFIMHLKLTCYLLCAGTYQRSERVLS